MSLGRVVDVFATVWGGAFGIWAFGKFVMSQAPWLCLPTPVAEVSGAVALLEAILGAFVVARPSRHVASLVGFATCLGLVQFAFIAADRGLPWKGCGCIWIGVEMPWVPGHVLFALALAVPFALIFLHEERRARAAKRAEIEDDGEDQ